MADLITRTKLCQSIPVAMLGAWMMSVCLAICNFMSDGRVVMAGIWVRLASMPTQTQSTSGTLELESSDTQCCLFLTVDKQLFQLMGL